MRKQILLGALTVFGLTLGTQVVAQESQFKCGLPQKLSKLYAENPQLEADYAELVQRYQTTETVDGKKRVIYRIPIVFHIIHEYGAENISDAQVRDEVDILNEDFRMLNADISQVIPQFDTVTGDAHIEFRLATIDPFGNCTNGIEHVYNHNANDGDDYSKLNQWHRNEYLNVWVVNSIGSAGVAGYAYYPTATTGYLFFADGILILDDYIGSIGTGTPFRSRALTHEIGHYLGLAHTWGSTNDPEIACGDDNISDTPITKGHDNCSNLYDMDCVDTIVENVQNFMEYSYCSNMYTKKQCAAMETTLLLGISGRGNLYKDSNLMLTGTYGPLAPPTCAPIADFYLSDRTVCVGDNVTYKDASWNAGVTTYEWSFPGGSPATSSATNPVVTYAQPGYYTATLTATNANGSHSKTFNNAVYVSGTWAEHIGPAQDNFEGSNFWIVQNPEDNHAYFSLVSGKGKDLSKCFKLNNYKDISNAAPSSVDSYYYDRLGGSTDYLISPSYDLSTTTSVSVSFDYSYGTNETIEDDMKDKLIVWSSKDCGKTWTPRKTITGAELVSAGYVANTDFAPTMNSQWRTATFNYSASSTDKKTRYRFEFTATDKSGNLYIDNFNVSGTLGISDNDGEALGISLSPNPVSTGSDISVEIASATQDVQLQVVDVNGQVISTTLVQASNGLQTVTIPMNVAKGCYFLQAVQGNSRSTHRVIVY